MSDDAHGRETKRGVMTEIVLQTFRLNGQLLAAAEAMARPAGLTAAWWQVLGAVLDGPMSVAGIARTMGLSRQAVQRIADLLVERGLADYQPNPAHRRAKLLQPTQAGWDAIGAIEPVQGQWANQVASSFTLTELQQARGLLDRLLDATSSTSE